MKRLALLLLFVASSAFAQVTTVFIVRHAEKTGATGDVPLSGAGYSRAQELSRILGDAGVTAIYASQFLRTQQTVAPLAAALHLTPVIFKTGDSYASEIAERVKKDGGTILIASHSDRIGPILKALGIGNPPPIADEQYDDRQLVQARRERERRRVRAARGQREAGRCDEQQKKKRREMRCGDHARDFSASQARSEKE